MKEFILDVLAGWPLLLMLLSIIALAAAIVYSAAIFGPTVFFVIVSMIIIAHVVWLMSLFGNDRRNGQF